MTPSNAISDTHYLVRMLIDTRIERDGDGNPRVVPGLISQLRDFTGRNDAKGVGSDASRPPMPLNAISLIDEMERTVAAYLAVLGITADTLEQGIARVKNSRHYHMTCMTDELWAQFNDDLMYWVRCAESIVSDPPYIPHIQCPVATCRRWSTIHVYGNGLTTCVACHAVWTDPREVLS